VPLSHLAIELGFDSQSHFTRVFRGLTGMTPGRLRREILG
jgi:AraC-like DNA-binding protein